VRTSPRWGPSVGRGRICRIHGVENCMSFEMLRVPPRRHRSLPHLDPTTSVRCSSGDWKRSPRADTVKRTKRPARDPWARRMLGRIVDPLGNPLDGKGEIRPAGCARSSSRTRCRHRQPVRESMLPLKGRRPMIPIGVAARADHRDRGTARPPSPSTRSSTTRTATHLGPRGYRSAQATVAGLARVSKHRARWKNRSS